MTQLEAIFRMVGDRETAADLCQETFVRAWRKAPRARGGRHSAARPEPVEVVGAPVVDAVVGLV